MSVWQQPCGPRPVTLCAALLWRRASAALVTRLDHHHTWHDKLLLLLHTAGFISGPNSVSLPHQTLRAQPDIFSDHLS